jgi:L-alanine-DL-glutamate epimerase-like enolase superfamily enzyme
MRIERVAHQIVRWPIEQRGAATRWREREAVIVAVHGDATGLGEAAPLPGMSIDAIDDAVAAVDALAARLPIVLDTPAHAVAVADRVTAAPAARFALESALLAAYAQHARTSVAALLAHGRPLAELRTAIVVDEPREVGVELRTAAATAVPRDVREARCIKIKADRDIRAIARAAPGARLRIDVNRAWPRDEVLARMMELAHLPIDFVEEPCANAHELLGWPLPCRIALDESLIDLPPDSLSRALGSPQLAALVLKPTLLGGFSRCLALAAEAHRHGVAPIVSHTLEGPIGYAACAELARAIGADVPVGLGPHPALRGAYAR